MTRLADTPTPRQVFGSVRDAVDHVHHIVHRIVNRTIDCTSTGR
jgi:hypothetical protein